ncbi:MAG: hypothetical protein J6Y03_03065 [Alphaproteobacteria bacterium]|nr:hypothetical protein [Alphaproteobacteria bacterium]
MKRLLILLLFLSACSLNVGREEDSMQIVLENLSPVECSLLKDREYLKCESTSCNAEKKEGYCILKEDVIKNMSCSDQKYDGFVRDENGKLIGIVACGILYDPCGICLVESVVKETKKEN